MNVRSLIAVAVFSVIVVAVSPRFSSAAVESIKGEVVDLGCYLGHGGAGSDHQECAQKCIKNGLPVGIKTDGGVYIAVNAEHGAANSVLASLAGKRVTADGEISERDGMKLIAVKKVTPQD